MNFRRVSIPIVLILTFLLQFLPGTAFAPRPVAAQACDAAQFIADATIPDGTSMAPGTTFLKTWRLKNVGTCTWTTSYSAVFTGGDQMGAPAVVNLPTSVAPGATVDISVNMTAPSSYGHYRGNWRLRNASGGLFGVGASGYSIFWVDIYVNANASYGTAYDFVANYASATWKSGAGPITPGSDGDPRGFVLAVNSPQLENGSYDANPGLVVNPQNMTGGYIQGIYPAFTVQAGDHFQSIINCAYNASNCYVNFRLNYQIGSGPVQTFWSFNERYDGLYYRANLDLSSLAGQSVNFILYMADVSGHGLPSGDRAEWVETKMARSGYGPNPPVPPSPTCDRGAFVSDVTIPDGSVLTPGQAFTKTWEIRNVGSCTWTTDYALVYVFGTPMGVASVVNLPSSIAPVSPGETEDFSVNMVAPSSPGHYRSYWRFRNAAGNQFGVGSGMITFFADIYVGYTGTNATTTTVSDSPDPSTSGQSVTVNVSVTGGSVTPTGTVSINGADSNCSLTLSSGSGSCNVVFNTTGGRTLTAIYSGDSSHSGSSGSVSHSVNPVSGSSSTTTITADWPDPSAAGQSVAVSVTVSGSGTTPTGTVAISGADNNCTITLSSGSGSCNVVFNTTGNRTLTALYSGDSTYSSSSDTESHTIASSSTLSTTNITADTPDPSIPGQVVDVDVTVTGTGTNPTGTVAITGADSNCTITLSGGGGSCSVIFNTVGVMTLTATYSGNANYAGSTDTESHTVGTGKAATATTITGNIPDPSIPGQAVVVSVTVSGAGLPAPTGTVDITGADNNCSILLAGGNGSCSVTFNSTGHRTIKATYSGDGKYAPSSGSVGHTVNKASATTSITAVTPEPSIPSQPVMVSFNVIGAGVTPTGIVSISGADVNCSITLSGGSGSCSVVFNTIGPKTLTASYSGDANYLPSTSSAGHTVYNATTTTIISDNSDPSKPGDSVMVTVTVSGTGTGTPTGNVDITGADSNCTIHSPLTTIGIGIGSGSCSVRFDTAGARILMATYEGGGGYVGSSGTASHTVDAGPSTTVINHPPTPETSVANESVTVDVTVSGASSVVPTGTVAISIGGVPSSCTITLVSGHGSCTVVFDTIGTYTITATYSGDGNYSGSWSNRTHVVH